MATRAESEGETGQMLGWVMQVLVQLWGRLKLVVGGLPRQGQQVQKAVLRQHLWLLPLIRLGVAYG